MPYCRNHLLIRTSVLAVLTGVSFLAAQPNTLTPDEIRQGWKLLFDGKSTDLWRGVLQETFPSRGWEVQDGMLVVLGQGSGDIVTRRSYSSFDLRVDFMMTPGANSGVKYFVQEYPDKKAALGMEYQILDDPSWKDKMPDARGKGFMASLYDLEPADAKAPRPVGEWNEARIMVKGKHAEHWLNGEKVLEFERGSGAFRKWVAGSKFRDVPGFGEGADGLILLQGHGTKVFFRNIKVREF